MRRIFAYPPHRTLRAGRPRSLPSNEATSEWLLPRVTTEGRIGTCPEAPSNASMRALSRRSPHASRHVGDRRCSEKRRELPNRQEAPSVVLHILILVGSAALRSFVRRMLCSLTASIIRSPKWNRDPYGFVVDFSTANLLWQPWLP